jgi:hypothetical protein
MCSAFDSNARVAHMTLWDKSLHTSVHEHCGHGAKYAAGSGHRELHGQR